MKKIAIMLLAALMLFAFVACDNTTGEPTVSDVAEAMTGKFTQTGVDNEITISDIQENLTIAEDGTVSGTLREYAINEAWGYNEAEDKYFAAIELTVTLDDGEKIFTEGGKYENTTGSTDKTCLVCVDSEDETKQEITFKVGTEAVSAEDLITLDFTGVTFDPAE